MADANAIRQVKKIIEQDQSRKFIVVSAPGKRNKADIKITDTLYACYSEIMEKGNCDNSFNLIRERYIGIANDLGTKIDIEGVLAQTEKEMIENKNADFCASRGEYLSALIFADFMNFEFVDAVEMIRFDSQGKLNIDYTDDIVKTKLKGKENVVIPGFYGKGYDGRVKTFSRGGSDITGSIIARGVMADIYENFTDVSGMMTADPRIVSSPKIIDTISYTELRELT